MVEWIDWWYQSEELGRLFVGSLILWAVLVWVGHVAMDNAATDAGNATGLILAIIGWISFLVAWVGLFGPVALRVILWVVTGE